MPSLQAFPVPILIAGVVSQRVVTGTAVIRTSLAIVKLITENVIGVTELALITEMNILRPVFPNRQAPSCC